MVPVLTKISLLTTVDEEIRQVPCGNCEPPRALGAEEGWSTNQEGVSEVRAQEGKG